jgi:hypothetical protein
MERQKSRPPGTLRMVRGIFSSPATRRMRFFMVVVLSPATELARYLAPHDHASYTWILRCTPQAAYTRLDSFLDRFAAFFSFGVRVAFFFSSLLFLSSLGMVFAPNICVWGYGPMPPYEIPVCA